MNTLLIGYDLNKVGQNYDGLIAAIEQYQTRWHHLDSTWMIRSTESASQVRTKLRQHIDQNDELLVINITDDDWASVGFSDRANSWLQSNV